MTKAKKPAQLGAKVRCMISGYTGIATQQVELLSGTVQLAVQPPLDPNAGTNGQYPEGANIDIQQLEYVEDGLLDRVVPAQATDIALGNEVEDTVTGFKGMTVSKHTFLNGCVYFHVQPKQTKEQREKGTIPLTEFFSAGRLKIVGKGVAPAARKELEKPVSTRTGGPTTRMSRI